MTAQSAKHGLILASASPRRRELLQQIGVRFMVAPVDLCEDVLPGESPETYVERLAIAKARACFESQADKLPVLGSDTTVHLHGKILGKPENEKQAVTGLMQLSGRTHQVLTAIALVTAEQTLSRVVTTDVTFGHLTETQCREYWATGEPADKAGGYAIQGYGAVFVQQIQGSYSAVVGLPLAETAALLTQSGIHIWQQTA